MKILLVLILFPAVCFAEKLNEEVIEKFSEFVDDIGAVKEAHVMNIDGFRVESALVNEINVKTDITKSTLSGEQTRMLNISKKDLPTIALGQKQNQDKSYGISIFKKESGEPALTLNDNDGDGAFDYLSYSVFDTGGNYIKEITDYGADGQIDIIIDFEKKEGKIYYEDVWLTSNKQKKFIFKYRGESISIPQARAYFEKNL